MVTCVTMPCTCLMIRDDMCFHAMHMLDDMCFHSMCPTLHVLIFAVCSARVIYESELMQDFLKSKEEPNGLPSQTTPPQDRRVDLCVILPNRSKCTVSINENSRSDEVLEVSILQTSLICRAML